MVVELAAVGLDLRRMHLRRRSQSRGTFALPSSSGSIDSQHNLPYYNRRLKWYGPVEGIEVGKTFKDRCVSSYQCVIQVIINTIISESNAARLESIRMLQMRIKYGRF